MIRTKTLAALLAATALTACAAPPADPTGRASADMSRVLAAYRDAGAKPVYDVSLEKARTQPSMGDAAAMVAQQMGMPAKADVAKVTDLQVQGAAGPLGARVYDPQASQGGPAPVILYFHGGGWVTGTLETYDATCRELAKNTGAIVISVQYRQGPENKFPAAHDDADAAYQWVLNNAATIGGDPRRIALAGESAGGNLALDTAIWARDKHLPMPVHELLVYPVAGTDTTTASYNDTFNAIPLNRKSVLWYVDHYTGSIADTQDPRLNVVAKADLHGLPPTTIIAAEIDPLRSEDEALAAKMQAAGTDVQQRTFPGVTHEFFGMGAVVEQAKAAEQMAEERLKQSFAQVQPEATMPTAQPMRHKRHMRHH